MVARLNTCAMIGVLMARFPGPPFGRGAEVIGGLILIGIGAKILVGQPLAQDSATANCVLMILSVRKTMYARKVSQSSQYRRGALCFSGEILSPVC
jgi:hypothetical protein